jgi:5-methylcytosine-specific restriction enzyme A
MAYWILQANPSIYRIFDALGDAEAIRTWTVAHHHQVIAPGDELALWASGPRSGVYAFGLVTEPAEFRPDDQDPYWESPAEKNEPKWRIGIRVTDVLERPIPRSAIAADPALASMLIVRMPGGGNPFLVDEAQWQAICSHRPGRLTGLRPTRNPPWTRNELLLDLYLRRRPQLPGADDLDVQQLSALLNSLPIHTVRPDLERFRNPNGVSLKLANFATLDPQYPGVGMRAGSRLDAQVWDRFASHPDELTRIVAAIRDTAVSLLPAISEPDDEDFEAEEGRLLTRLHRHRERNASLVRRKKEAALRAHGRLTCQACGFDFAVTYGDLGAGFIGAHHILPLATAGPATTRLADLALVCSNCHRMLHRAKPWITPGELSQRLT